MRRLVRKFLLFDASLPDFLRSCGVKLGFAVLKEFFVSQKTAYRMESGLFYRFEKERRLPELVSKDEFFSAYESHIYQDIVRDRYSFGLDENLCHIDIYKKELEGLCILELEFSDELKGLYFKQPDFLTPFISREISDQSEFKAFNLARFGYFNESGFSISSTLARINLSGVKPFAPASIAIKFALLAMLTHLKLDFLNSKNGYLAVRCSACALLSFKAVFDEKICQHLFKELESFSHSLATDRFLFGLIKLLKKRDKSSERALLALLQKASEQRDYDKDSISEYELLLQDESGFYLGEMAKETCVKSSVRAMISQLDSLLQELSQIGDESKNKQILKLLLGFLNAWQLQEYFGHIWGDVGLENFKKALKALLKLEENEAYIALVLRSTEQPKKLISKLMLRSQKARQRLLKAVLPAKGELEELKNLIQQYKE